MTLIRCGGCGETLDLSEVAGCSVQRHEEGWVFTRRTRDFRGKLELIVTHDCRFSVDQKTPSAIGQHYV